MRLGFVSVVVLHIFCSDVLLVRADTEREEMFTKHFQSLDANEDGTLVFLFFYQFVLSLC